MTDRSSKQQLHVCPDCRNQFVQPFKCTTCGAQKLYDETVRSQAAQIEHLQHAFKNFHRALCERFGYFHDEVDWQRDQVSLIEHIAKRGAVETPAERSVATACEILRTFELALVKIDTYSPASTVQPVQIAREALTKAYGPNYRSAVKTTRKPHVDERVAGCTCEGCQSI